MDLETICRVCLQGGDMVSLFDCDENNELLSDKYAYCCSVEVSDAEPLPLNICLICVDRLMSAYQFKQQCLSSNETLKECLKEFKKSNSGRTVKKGSEIITIKQENGVYLQYEIPVEEEGGASYQILEGVRRKRGRPRKYPDASGVIPISPYIRKSGSQQDSDSGTLHLKLKEEPAEDIQGESSMDEGELVDFGDPEYLPGDDPDNDLKDVAKSHFREHKTKRRTKKSEVLIKTEAESDRDEEDVLLKETIMANSEPIPEALLNPAKEKRKYPKKKYFYDKIHTCDQCGSSFRSNASLQAHIRRHLGIKPFSCTICGYSCVLNMELRRHMMRHTGVKPYKCRICDRYFGDFGSRQKHERLHLGERPYQCSLCGKSFTYSYVLSNHMLTHTGEKKYECQPCNKKFTKAHHLKYHNKVHHKDLYNQELLLQQSKKTHTMLQSVNIADLTSVCTEQLLGLQGAQIVGNTIQIQHPDQEGQEHEQNEYVDADHDQQEYTENEYEASQHYEDGEEQFTKADVDHNADMESGEYITDQPQHIEYTEHSSNDDASQETTDALQVAAGDQEMEEEHDGSEQDIKSIHITYTTSHIGAEDTDGDDKQLPF